MRALTRQLDPSIATLEQKIPAVRRVGSLCIRGSTCVDLCPNGRRLIIQKNQVSKALWSFRRAGGWTSDLKRDE